MAPLYRLNCRVNAANLLYLWDLQVRFREDELPDVRVQSKLVHAFPFHRQDQHAARAVPVRRIQSACDTRRETVLDLGLCAMSKQRREYDVYHARAMDDGHEDARLWSSSTVYSMRVTSEGNTAACAPAWQRQPPVKRDGMFFRYSSRCSHVAGGRSNESSAGSTGFGLGVLRGTRLIAMSARRRHLGDTGNGGEKSSGCRVQCSSGEPCTILPSTVVRKRKQS